MSSAYKKALEKKKTSKVSMFDEDQDSSASSDKESDSQSVKEEKPSNEV